MRLKFSPREIDLLVNLLSYDIEAYVNKITPNSYEGGVSKEQMMKFVNELKASAAGAKQVTLNTIKRSLSDD